MSEHLILFFLLTPELFWFCCCFKLMELHIAAWINEFSEGQRVWNVQYIQTLIRGKYINTNFPHFCEQHYLLSLHNKDRSTSVALSHLSQEFSLCHCLSLYRPAGLPSGSTVTTAANVTGPRNQTLAAVHSLCLTDTWPVMSASPSLL